MINSNCYPYLYFLIAVFATSVNICVAAEYDNYEDFVPPASVQVQFIDVDHPEHPSNLCKVRLNISDGEWREYHQEIIPSNICAKYITCMGTGYNNIEYAREPSEGVRCQRVTQNEIYNFGYGCYDRRCVPITCLDHTCWKRLLQNRMERLWASASENMQSPSIDRPNEHWPGYEFLRRPVRKSSYRKPSTSAPETISSFEPSQDDRSHIIYFTPRK